MLPEFLEFTEKEDSFKFGSKEQKQNFLQVECDQSDAKITDRLKSGVRPGNFCKEFEKLSFVRRTLSDRNCEPFVKGIREWMAKMSETCKGINALPENVGSRFRDPTYLLIIVSASTAVDSTRDIADVGPTRTMALLLGRSGGSPRVLSQC